MLLVALVSTGIKSGLVTVAAEFWQLYCWPLKSNPRPSRGGFVCLDATRVFLQESSSLAVRNLTLLMFHLVRYRVCFPCRCFPLPGFPQLGFPQLGFQCSGRLETLCLL